MARRYTRDHETIRRWAEQRGGRPARVRGSPSVLRLAFSAIAPNWEPIDWPTFFEAFDQTGLTFMYEDRPGSTICKLVKGEVAEV